MKKVAEIEEVGHKLLSLFDIEYHSFSEEITDKLMAHPNKKFKLILQEVKNGA